MGLQTPVVLRGRASGTPTLLEAFLSQDEEKINKHNNSQKLAGKMIHVKVDVPMLLSYTSYTDRHLDACMWSNQTYNL